jgi:hypothetical protein
MSDSDGFEYVMSIEDGVSGPAKAEKDALRGLQGQILSTEKQLRALQSTQLNYRRSGFSGAAKDVGLEVQQVRQHIAGLRADVASNRLLGMQALGALAVAGEAGHLGLEAEKFAIDAAMFKTDTTLAYTAVKGTAEEGAAVFAQIDQMARMVHMPAEKAHDLARDLMLQGLEDTRLIGSTIAAQSALIRTGQLQGAEKLHSIIERSLASGHFEAGKLGGGKKGQAPSGRALAGLGVHLPDLFNDLSKRLGIGVDQVQAQLKAGKVATEVGVAALVDAINTGVIGKTAAAKYDIHDFATDAMNSLKRMVENVDLKPLENSLFGVSEALRFTADRKDGVQGLLQMMIDMSADALDSIEGFALGVEIAALRIELALKPATDALAKMTGPASTLGHIASAMFDNPTTHNNLEKFDKELANASPEEQAKYAEYEASMGRTPVDAGAKAGKDFIKGARDATDTHSPSEEMARFGEDLSDGLGKGFTARSASEAMRGAGESGGGRSVMIDLGGIHVNAGTGADAHVIAALAESAVIDAFDRLRLELGG